MLRRQLILMLCATSWASAPAQDVVVNEFKLLINANSIHVETDVPWIELANRATDSVSLSEYRLCFNSTNCAALPDVKIPPLRYFTLWFGDAVKTGANEAILDVSYPDSIREISIIEGESASKIAVPRGITPNESYGRYPENSDDWIFFPDSAATPGRFNKYPGPWQKLAAETSFEPRDSSPNGALVYDGKVWILEGYKYFGKGLYGSTSDVHSSVDGINWNSVNESPPYHPYSAFIVFDDWMWAFENRAYRSKDGLHWEDMGAIPLSNGGRIALLDGKLYWTSGRDIYRSEDGITWELLVYDGPWEIRAWPGFQAMNGKLWLFGGAGNWNTFAPHYYNDVWSSTDGITWQLEIEHANFPGRYWFTSHVFDDKLWILGGYSLYSEFSGDPYKGNMNDIWYSEDGVNWTQLATGSWPQRHAALSWVNGRNLFISSGADGYLLLNDVWRFEKKSLSKQEFIFNGIDTLYTYGDPPSEVFDSDPEVSRINLTIERNSIASWDGKYLQPKKSGNALLRIKADPNILHYGGEITFGLTINKRLLEVKVTDTSKLFGDEVPEFNLQYSGFVNGDDVSSLDQPPSVSTDAHRFAPLGEYILFSTGGESDNYHFVHHSGVLTVEGRDEIVMFPVPARDFLDIISSKEENVIARVEIYDTHGKIAYEKDVNNFQCRLPLESVPAGVYTLVARSVSKHLPVTTRRFIVLK